MKGQIRCRGCRRGSGSLIVDLVVRLPLTTSALRDLCRPPTDERVSTVFAVGRSPRGGVPPPPGAAQTRR